MIPALLLELLVKSSLVAAAGLALSSLPCFRVALDRVNVLRTAVCLLIALPIVMVFGPQIPVWIAEAPVPVEPITPTAGPAWSGQISPVSRLTVAGSIGFPSPWTLLAIAYLLGGLLVFGHFLAGVWTLWRWTSTGREIRDPAWTSSLAELGGTQSRPRLVAAASVAAPLSWGLPPGVILIGPAQMARPQDASTVLAHELAHLRRRDWIFLALSRLALALFWFNPLVWKLHATLAARTEEAADADALKHVDRHAYARTLLSLASALTPQSATGMTGPARSLSKRISTIMKAQSPSPSRPLAMALAVGAIIAVASPLAALEFVARPPAPAVAAQPTPPAGTTVGANRVAITPSTTGQTVTLPGVVIHQGSLSSLDDLPSAAGAEHQQVLREASDVQAQAEVLAQEARRLAGSSQSLVALGAELSRLSEGLMHAQSSNIAILAREQVRSGADAMAQGARTMRETSVNLRDPAFRAEQIRQNRERGDTVTDEELQAMIPSLAAQADEMEEAAAQMRGD